MKSRNFQYLTGVDHLRAYAAILVVLYHATSTATHTHNPIKAIFLQGNFGVALFMALSGFIFTVGLLGKDINYLGFMKNRIVRIYPLYIFTLLAAMTAFPSAVTFDNLAFSFLPFINMPQAFHTQILSGLNPFAMSWTIALELQFYLLFPFILALLNKKKFRQLLYLWAAVVLMRFMLSTLPGSNDTFISYYSIFGRFDQFAFGIIGGVLFVNYKELIKKYSVPVLCSSLLVLAAMSMIINNKLGDTSLLTGVWSVSLPFLYGLLSACIICSYVVIVQSLKLNIVSRGIAKVGELSYSIYLTHILVMIVLSSLLPHLLDGLGHSWHVKMLYGIFVVVPATIAVSFITYNGIERPFLEMRKKYTKPVPLKVAEQEI